MESYWGEKTYGKLVLCGPFGARLFHNVLQLEQVRKGNSTGGRGNI